MSAKDIWVPPNPSAAYKKRNPHLYQQSDSGDRVKDMIQESKRVRQNPKPLMNKLEQEWFDILNAQFPNYPRPRAQAKRYRLANGSWYRPDVTASIWPIPMGPAGETAWECKGPKEMKNNARGMLTIKFAAAAWPEVRFVLVWKEKGQWKEQVILP